MKVLEEYKQNCLDYLHREIPLAVEDCKRQGLSEKTRAKVVNRSITNHHKILQSQISPTLSKAERQQRQIVLQYCVSVAYFEYRHAVWPYEYMTLSRRVGELWEKFCSSAWDFPARSDVKRISPPSFEHVLDQIRESLLRATKDNRAITVARIFDDLRDVIGVVNMKEDEVFTVGDTPFVIDFKSGFGSNEKGNMLRIRAIGKAYRLWNSEVCLLLLVRQESNNNYLNVIEREELWEVYCGSKAYAMIDRLTGSNIEWIRKNIIDFRGDLSQNLWNDFEAAELTDYLRW